MGQGKLTFLGTGTSQGIPVIACDCEVCTSIDSNDKRLRTAALLTIHGKNYVIDTGPDFRQQMLQGEVKSLEGVLFTHEHKDHVAGLDDVRAFNFRQKKAMNIYCTPAVETALKREFYYAFEPADKRYPGVPELVINAISNTPFNLDGVEVIPIQVWHHKMPVKGFRVGNMAYITDANRIDPEELEKLKNLDVLVLNALRKSYHISHFTLNEAVELIQTLKPKQAYLTHISHLLGKHEEVNRELPSGVQLAHDGLEVGFKVC